MNLETDNMSREYYVAGDAHKDFVTVTVLDPKGKMIEQFEVPAKPSGMEDIIKKMNRKKFCYMAETSSYSIDLHNYLVSRGVDAILVVPKNLKLITDSHKKTDEHESGRRARLGPDLPRNPPNGTVVGSSNNKTHNLESDRK